jgi:hypothetical protein
MVLQRELLRQLMRELRLACYRHAIHDHLVLEIIFVFSCGHVSTIWAMTETEANERVGMMCRCTTCNSLMEVTGWKVR